MLGSHHAGVQMTREQRLKQTIWETVMEGTAHCGWTDRAREGLVKSVQDAVLWADHAAPAGDDGEVRDLLEVVRANMQEPQGQRCFRESEEFWRGYSKANKDLEAELLAARAHAPKDLETFEFDKSGYVELPTFEKSDAHAPRSQGAEFPQQAAYEAGFENTGKLFGEPEKATGKSTTTIFVDGARWMFDYLASRPKAEGRVYTGVPYLKYDFGTTKPKSICPDDGSYFEVTVREVPKGGG